MRLFIVLLMFLASQSGAQADDRIKEATDLILKLCIVEGETIQITQNGDSVEVSGQNGSLTINKTEWIGLVGGISKDITSLSAEQTSEARDCTQKYLRELLAILLKDGPAEPAKDTQQAEEDASDIFWGDPARYWGKKGLWQDNLKFCDSVTGLIEAASDPENFSFADNGEDVSLAKVSGTRKIQGNFFIKTDPGSSAHFCAVLSGPEDYFGLGCSRLISVDNPQVFATVYTQTLDDLRSCLFPKGWSETTVDQGACIPEHSSSSSSECIHRFSNGVRDVSLFSNLEANNRYTAGLQMVLGPER